MTSMRAQAQDKKGHRLYLLWRGRYKLVGFLYVDKIPVAGKMLSLIRGYGLVAALEGKGFASHMLRTALAWLHREPYVLADIDPRNNARSVNCVSRNAGVLGRGFLAIGTVDENGDFHLRQIVPQKGGLVEYVMPRKGERFWAAVQGWEQQQQQGVKRKATRQADGAGEKRAKKGKKGSK